MTQRLIMVLPCKAQTNPLNLMLDSTIKIILKSGYSFEIPGGTPMFSITLALNTIFCNTPTKAEQWDVQKVEYSKQRIINYIHHSFIWIKEFTMYKHVNQFPSTIRLPYLDIKSTKQITNTWIIYYNAQGGFHCPSQGLIFWLQSAMQIIMMHIIPQSLS